MIEFVPLTIGKIVTTLGLLSDILGAVLIAFFGIPKLITRDGGTVPSFGYDANSEQKAKLLDRLSEIGMGLLVFGFIGQIIGSWLR